MIQFINTLHSHNRWLILLAAIAAIGSMIHSLIKGQGMKPLDARLIRFYGAFLTLQFLLGIILLVNLGTAMGWDMAALRLHMEHAFTMFLALGAAHFTARWRKSSDPGRIRNMLFCILASLVLIIAGVARLRGMAFWFGG